MSRQLPEKVIQKLENLPDSPGCYQMHNAAGKVLKKHGIHITNYAGEDPSTLEVLAMQAGAHWYAIDGDSWKVNFQDEGSLKAADVIQQIIDGGLIKTM